MRITLVAPVRPGTSSGNDVTAARWRRRLTELGHEVRLAPLSPDCGPQMEDPGAGADVLVVLHARRCAPAVAASRAQAPDRPVVVCLAGTDLYVDLPDDPEARASIDAADAVVVLQPRARDRLAAIDRGVAAKTIVLHQSVDLPPLTPDRHDGRFVVAVLAHLREVKDPLLTARAARRLPETSRVAVIHAGGAHDPAWAESARAEMRDNPRYTWRNELPRTRALELLAGADVLACTSIAEGGANVVSEAIALGVPVIGTDIEGTRGLVGDDHPGLVPVGDEAALADVIAELEGDEEVRADARRRVEMLRPLVDPATERATWIEILDGVRRV